MRCGRWYGVLPDRSQVPVLADGVEAGALLAEIEIEMARDDGIREVGVETLNELAKNSNLFGCTSVFDFTHRNASSDTNSFEHNLLRNEFF